MAIDSAAKRKSVTAIGSLFVGPAVVPDSSLSLFDRQVIGYGYGGIEVGGPATAGFIKVRNVSLSVGYATATLKTGHATATLKA